MRVERTNFGQRIVNSFVGVLIGILLFFGSFLVLFLNEGRENLANYAKKAKVYQSENVYSKDELLYTVGKLNASTFAGDDFLNNGNYIYIERYVEMYCYVEKEHQETKENIGGSTTTVVTYTYELSWTSSPAKTTTFKGDNTEKPTNLPEQYDSWITNMPQNQNNTGSGFSINSVNMSPNGLILSNAKDLALSTDITKNLNANDTISNNFIFRKNSTNGTINQPGVGDIRIYYHVITADDEGILFGRIENNSFTSFVTKKNNTFYRFFSGIESQNQAVSILQAEYKLTLWIFRIVGFVMMFIGLLLFSRPLTTLLSVIPFFAKMGRFIFGVFSFFISLFLTTITIILGIIFNNIYLASLFVLLIIGIIILVLIKKKNQKENTPNKISPKNNKKANKK